ncbi:hemerythrin domain-containing protein [Gilvimarinus sp. F26214L]|uniref:hemerythrin domain-containing protein n=1 Tax=Gilvimarinus sp. DZF01 TaxID=3461371 RepID=UPI004045830F
MNIFELIRVDHRYLRELLDGISATKGDSVDRRKLFAQLLDAMKTHTLAEEQSLYSALMGWPELTEQCRQFVIEHAEADELLQDLEYEDMGHPAWKIKFYRLRHLMEKHMEEEEQLMLPRAENLVSRSQADYLSGIYSSRKRGYEQVA